MFYLYDDIFVRQHFGDGVREQCDEKVDQQNSDQEHVDHVKQHERHGIGNLLQMKRKEFFYLRI